jgi:hypothetical protein
MVEETRRKIQDMAQACKIVHGLDRVNRITLFNHIPEGRKRLAADPLNMRAEQTRTDVIKFFFTQRIVAGWNAIAAADKNSKNVQEFKKNLKKYMTTDGEP